MDSQLKRGVLDVCVLAALRKEESYGYKIISDVSPYIVISESTLYPILKRLENAKMVTTRSQEFNGRLRRYYSITNAGRLKIEEFLEDINELEKIHEFISGGKNEQN